MPWNSILRFRFIRYQTVFRAFCADTKSYRYGMNSNGTELEQVVHTLTSNIVQERLAERFWFSNSQFSNSSLIPNSLLPLRSKYLHTTPKCGRQNLRYKPLHFRDRLGAVRDWSKSKGGWAGAFGNVVDKKHMTHPLPLAQKWLTHP